jgi:predicted alpha-1,6-mannanase (GH76 family)
VVAAVVPVAAIAESSRHFEYWWRSHLLDRV